jgi:hypothetical protein
LIGLTFKRPIAEPSIAGYQRESIRSFPSPPVEGFVK